MCSRGGRVNVSRAGQCPAQEPEEGLGKRESPRRRRDAPRRGTLLVHRRRPECCLPPAPPSGDVRGGCCDRSLARQWPLAELRAVPRPERERRALGATLARPRVEFALAPAGRGGPARGGAECDLTPPPWLVARCRGKAKLRGLRAECGARREHD